MSTPERESKRLKPCYVVLEPITPKLNPEFSTELKNAINERNLLTNKTRKRVTDALEEIENENQLSRRQTRKNKIINEIMQSEENYIRQLEILMEFFIRPTQKRGLLATTDFDILFSDILTIYKINKELLGELNITHTGVGKAFSKIAPFFKCYSIYASQFKRSLETLKTCQRHNPKFAKFLEMQESRPEVQSKLSALLIVPIQRVPRYKLLLSSLFNLTSPSEEDYKWLSDSLHKVEDAADHINKVIQEQENMQRLIELQRCLQNGEPNVITPGRNLIKEGLLFRISKSSHSHKMHVVLMNDIIMFCKMKKDALKANSLKCSGIYPLSKSKVKTVRDKGAFKVMCQDEEIVLYDDSYEETMKWAETIDSAIDTLVSDRKTLRKESTVRRPVKRKHLNEYNEVGLSPGKKLKKKKLAYEDQNGAHEPLLLAKRRPLRTTFQLPSPSSEATPSFLITLKPPEMREQAHCEQEEHNGDISKELFVFGEPHPEQSFSFKMNRWLCGIGSTVKKFLGFKK